MSSTTRGARATGSKPVSPSRAAAPDPGRRHRMKTWVALLRGVNVGGKNTIPMSELKSSLSSLGLEDVVTYIQSGNVVFRSSAGHTRVAGDIEQRIAEAFGVSVTVLLRTPAELRTVA